MPSSVQPSQHPPTVDLVAYADGALEDRHREEVRSHVATCAECSSTIDGLLGPLAGEPHLSAEVQPRSLLALEDLVARPVGEPRSGELWRLLWDDTAVFALVVSTTGLDVDVVPVTAEAPDDISPARLITLGTPHVPDSFCSWPSLRATVPLGVFDGPLTTQPQSPVDVSALDDDAISWTTAVRRTAVAMSVQALSSAMWVPDASDAVSLRELLAVSSLRPTDVADRTGIPVAQLTPLLRGRRSPTAREAKELAGLFGVSARQLRAPVSVPAALRHAIERPVHRAAVRARAVVDAVTEATERLLLAERLLVRPARTTAGDRDVDTWDELLRQELDA